MSLIQACISVLHIFYYLLGATNLWRAATALHNSHRYKWRGVSGRGNKLLRCGWGACVQRWAVQLFNFVRHLLSTLTAGRR